MAPLKKECVRCQATSQKEKKYCKHLQPIKQPWAVDNYRNIQELTTELLSAPLSTKKVKPTMAGWFNFNI